MKKRICIFLEKWSSGGIESLLTDVLSHMTTDNIDVDVVAHRVEQSVFTDRLLSSGINLIELSGKVRSFKNKILFTNLMKKKHYDVLHVNTFHSLSIGYAAIAKRLGVPKRIVHSHGAGLRKSILRPLKLLAHYVGRALYGKYATDRWACSRKAGEFLFGKRDFLFLPNGIDASRFEFNEQSKKRIRESLGLTNEKVVGCVARLSSEKNQIRLIDALSESELKNTNTVLLLVGDGDDEYKAELTKRAEEKGVAPRVIFYGASDDVPSMLCAIDVFVLPSIAEGFGIAAIEAQASGLPTLCSDAVPKETEITDLISYLPLSSGAKVWAGRIAEMLSSDAERQGKSAVVEQSGYDIESCARKVAWEYEK